jgi:hypothetical protein
MYRVLMGKSEEIKPLGRPGVMTIILKCIENK